MKRLLFFVLAFGLLNVLKAQNITIPNRVYRTGETITASISGFVGNMGVENDFKRASENISVNGSINYTVGSAQKPGPYVVRFTNGNFTKSFTLFILPAGSTYANLDLVKEAKPVKGLSSRFMDNLVGFKADDWKEVNKKSFAKYAANHAVSTTTTFLICVVAVAEPTLWIQCGSGFAGNAKDYTMIMLEEAGAKMLTNQSISQEEFNKIKTNLTQADFALSLLQGFTVSGGKIKLDNLELLGGTANYIAETSTNSEKAKTFTNTSTEFAKKVNVLVEFSKLP